MKKIITICLLAFTILAGGTTMDAKTTKKKAKAKTQTALYSSNKFGLMSFLEHYNKYWNLKSEEKIFQTLSKYGFIK